MGNSQNALYLTQIKTVDALNKGKTSISWLIFKQKKSMTSDGLITQYLTGGKRGSAKKDLRFTDARKETGRKAENNTTEIYRVGLMVRDVTDWINR